MLLLNINTSCWLLNLLSIFHFHCLLVMLLAGMSLLSTNTRSVPCKSFVTEKDSSLLLPSCLHYTFEYFLLFFYIPPPCSQHRQRAERAYECRVVYHKTNHNEHWEWQVIIANNYNQRGIVEIMLMELTLSTTRPAATTVVWHVSGWLVVASWNRKKGSEKETQGKLRLGTELYVTTYCTVVCLRRHAKHKTAST